MEKLKEVRTRDQLLHDEIDIQKAFAEIHFLLGQIKEYQQLNPDSEPPPLTFEDKELSEQLRLEILRVCRLDGGKEVIDRCKLNNP